MEVMQDPTLAGVLAKEGGEIARELVHALALADDPPSMLRGRLGVSKRVACAEPIDLEEVKAVGRACDCTVNDVLMAAAAGALREYMLERGDNVDGMTVRATGPVILRDRRRVVWGKSGAGRVDIGGRRMRKKKKPS